MSSSGLYFYILGSLDGVALVRKFVTNIFAEGDLVKLMGNVLTVNNLKTYYHTERRIIPAVDGVSLSLGDGELLGIVGESGCGKSTVARSIAGLINREYANIEAGEVLFEGQDLVKTNAKDMHCIRGKEISMIFQDPFVSLNPVYTVESQMREILENHTALSRMEIRERIIEMLHLVDIPDPEKRMKYYPYQLSGGMQQRVMIAIALSCNPKILLADEPTTALDCTVQAQILDLILKLKEEFNMSVLLISHDLGVVAQMCDRMLIMYGGVVVEQGRTLDIFTSPHHPYTHGLLASVPNIKEDQEELKFIKGHVPVFSHPVTRCRFSDRCNHAFEKCRVGEPPLFNLDGGGLVRCWLFERESSTKMRDAK